MESQDLVLPTATIKEIVLMDEIKELKNRVNILENKLHDRERQLQNCEEAARELISENLSLEIESKNTEKKIDELTRVLLGEEVSMKRLRLLLTSQSCFLVRKEFSQLCRMLENLDYNEIQSLQEKITNEHIKNHETGQLMSNVEVFARMHRNGQVENINELSNLDLFNVRNTSQ